MVRVRGAAFSLACSLTMLAGGAAAQPLTLDEALGFAYETNPQLAAQQAALRATDEGVAQANAGYRPTVNAQGSYGMQRFGFTPSTFPNPKPPPSTLTLSEATAHPVQGQLTVTEPIFRGGRTYAEIRRAKAQVRAGRAQLTTVEQTVLLSAVTAYMDVDRDEAIVKLRQSNVGVLTKQRDATQIQFRAGALTRTDVAQSEARLAGAQSDLTAAQGQLAVSRADFLQAIGRPAETLQTDPGIPQVPGSEADLTARAIKQSPVLITALENERAAGFGVDDSYGALLPQLSVQGQYFYSQGALTNNVGGIGSVDHGVAVLGLLNVPIYQGGADHAAVRQAQELHDQARRNVDVANRQVEDAATSAWQSFQSAQATIQSNEATEQADEIAFQGVSKEQQVGGRTILDVLNAQQELLNAQVAVVTAKRNTVVAAYQVLAAEGALTAKFLGLKVKFYDPNDHYEDDESRWIGFGG
jgi:outer membrane protein